MRLNIFSVFSTFQRFDIALELDAEIRNLMYADVLKLFSKIRDTNDTRRFQLSIDTMEVWCDINEIDLNIDLDISPQYRSSSATPQSASDRSARFPDFKERTDWQCPMKSFAF